MKTEIKQTLRDLRAAAMLGKPEAVDVAMNGLLTLPGVSANDRMSDGFIEKVVVPVGEALSGMPSHHLRPLLTHELAIGRAVGAVAMAHRFVKGSNSTQKDLQRPGADPRSDVRQALGRALLSTSTINPEKVFELGRTWLNQASPKLRHSALVFLPALAEHYPSEVISLLTHLDEDDDPEVRSALANTLSEFGRLAFAELIFGLLSVWSKKPRPNSWVICRILSASWVADHPSEAKAILREIQSRTGDSSQITNALKALKRHGVEIDI